MAEAPKTQKSLSRRIYDSRVWKSIFRLGYPKDSRTQLRIVATNIWLHIKPSKVSRYTIRFTYTFGLGGLSFWFFLLLTFTGVLLMFYYVPSVDMAYDSILALHAEVRLGAFLRNLHRWAAHAMVLSVFLHMMRVFYTGSYKPPREFNWVIGVFLWVVTMLMSYTGYLLPWDQLALWAVTIGSNIAEATPFVGKQMKFLIFGGAEVGQNTLVRFYTLHVIFLPLLTAALLAVHFWRIRRDGGLSGPWEAEDEEIEV